MANLRPANLFASIDLGTHSFKLLIVHFEPTTSKITTLFRLSHPIVLGHHLSSSSPPLISSDCQVRAIEALTKFRAILCSHNVGCIRVVATSAIREASNGSEFVNAVRENLGFDSEVIVLSGVEEARLTYIGVLQFFPVHDKRVLTVDIGGGSTEFVVGDHGEVLFAESLRLGHVILTQKFSERNLVELRGYIRDQIEASGLVDKLKELGFEVAIGSSGTIRAIEKAIACSYGSDEGENLLSMEGRGRKWWWFNREELTNLVERLCDETDKVRIDEFFRKSKYIVAGAILLEEILELLWIKEMQVSGYALGDGVVAEMISGAFVECDLNFNARWKSVARVAMRFNGKERMNAGSQSALIAKNIYEGLRKCEKADENNSATGFFLDDEDLEYLEAACVLHNIGLYSGKKGYHKRSYSIIMESDQLNDYAMDEIELIALLARHHRKKFPRFDNSSVKGFSGEKIAMLCCILRLSVVLQKLELREIELNHSCEGIRLSLVEDDNQLVLPGYKGLTAKNIQKKIRKEVEHFEMAFHRKLFVVQAGCLKSS